MAAVVVVVAFVAGELGLRVVLLLTGCLFAALVVATVVLVDVDGDGDGDGEEGARGAADVEEDGASVSVSSLSSDSGSS